MKQHKSVMYVVASLGVLSPLFAGCGGSESDLPTTGPENVTRVAESGFQLPGDAVSSPDGETFYFTAFTDEEEPQAGIFAVPSMGGDVSRLHVGTPLEYPTGLVLSCDGETLYVADMGSLTSEVDEEDEGESDGGVLYQMPTSGGTPTPIETSGITVPTGLALSWDCTTLYATGWNEDGEPAVFNMPARGGATSVVYAGDPLMSVTGIHVDVDNVAWVMDHVADGPDGQGVLFAITADGEISPVISALRMGTPGGVSLAAGGVTAVIPVTNEDGEGELLTVSTATGDMNTVEAPEMLEPAGIRSAREAGVFALVDSEGGAIFRAE